ncbi:MAG: D-alanyl-D-alanine carboxypeptidase [Ruminococcaceae bacterium]|nr:D-alanyl-D-alanine carboxypeptidase [Oscillospiraceae bacterium]
MDMKRFFRVLSLMVALIIILGTTFSALAISFDYSEPLESETVLLVNMDTGIPVLEKNADEVRFPASLTKIMTYIVAYENIEDVYNTRVEIRQEVLNPLLGTGSSMSGLDYKVGESVTVIDLLYCMMVNSGNDAALVLADYVGKGDTDKFVEMMNKKAKELGCENTHFVNPHGLHDADHYSTARDLYKITTYALALPLFAEITNTATYYCEGDDYPLVTTNYMIDVNRGGDYYYTYAKGVKTGTTDEAGRCLITTGIADGYAYMCICMGAPYENSDHNGAMTDAKGLLRWALTQLELARTLVTETPGCEVNVNFSNDTDSILLYPIENVYSILPKERNEEDVKLVCDAPESVDAPVKKGDVIGSVTVYYKDDALKTVDLVAGEDVEKSDITYTVHVFKSVLNSWQFWIAVGIAVVLLIIYIALISHIRTKNKRRRVKKYRRM